MWLLITGSLIVGTIAKKAIYSHIFKTKISEQPINILILSEHLVRHACSIVLLASLSISLMFDGSIRQMIERFDLMKSTSYCWFYHYAGTFMVVYLRNLVEKYIWRNEINENHENMCYQFCSSIDSSFCN